jgi:Luciferase-like monooxygenase
MALEFGIWDHFEQQNGVPLSQQYEERIQLIVQAERYGFSRYHVAEHHLTPLDMAPSPTVFLAAVAQRTSRIRLGSMVFGLNPLEARLRYQETLEVIRQGLIEGKLSHRGRPAIRARAKGGFDAALAGGRDGRPGAGHHQACLEGVRRALQCHLHAH